MGSFWPFWGSFRAIFYELKQKRTHFKVYIMSQDQQRNNSDWVNNASSLPSENPPTYTYATDPVFDRFPEPPPTYDGKPNTKARNQCQTGFPFAEAHAQPPIPVTRSESRFSCSNWRFQPDRKGARCLFIFLVLTPAVYFGVRAALSALSESESRTVIQIFHHEDLCLDSDSKIEFKCVQSCTVHLRNNCVFDSSGFMSYKKLFRLRDRS